MLSHFCAATLPGAVLGLASGAIREAQSRVSTPIGMQAFKDGAVRFLICTDVAARGLDISGLPYVINVTLPDRAEDYIHRVGRVGELSACTRLSWRCC